MVFTCLIYLAVGIMAIMLFGTSLQPNVLLSIEKIGLLSLLMKMTFIVVIICHVPFVFICCKEGACIIADEFINGTLTQSISNTSKGLKSIKAIEAQIISDMDYRVYYGVTVSLYISCMVTAIVVDNLLVLFDYLSALTVSGIQFLIPGLCYVILSRNHPGADKRLKALSYSYIGISFIVTLTILYSL